METYNERGIQEEQLSYPERVGAVQTQQSMHVQTGEKDSTKSPTSGLRLAQWHRNLCGRESDLLVGELGRGQEVLFLLVRVEVDVLLGLAAEAAERDDAQDPDESEKDADTASCASGGLSERYRMRGGGVPEISAR